jgi:integrase
VDGAAKPTSSGAFYLAFSASEVFLGVAVSDWPLPYAVLTYRSPSFVIFVVQPVFQVITAELPSSFQVPVIPSPRVAFAAPSLDSVISNGCPAVSFTFHTPSKNPMLRVEQVPSPGESSHGMALDADSLRRVVEGFRRSALFPVVATAALTGARRNEILALRWTDFDLVNKSLRIERAIEETKAGLTFKAPKTKRGTRTIAIDDELVALLTAEREKYLRLVAGVPDSATVDLSLVRLPDGALMFPSPARDRFDFTRLRDPHAVTRGFVRHARRLGFKGLRFHDLRGAHETALLDAGVPVHTVAARCGHSPAVLLENYAKHTRKADRSAAAVIASLSKGILG